MSPEEVQAALKRGAADPTLKAVMDFVIDMTVVSVGEATGFWTASSCNTMRETHCAAFIVAMEKAAAPKEG